MKKTRRAQFLEEMERVVPWADLYSLVQAQNYLLGSRYRSLGVEGMLRIYFLQLWFALSDSEVEDALSESWVMRRFVGVDINEDLIPDENAVATFRDFLEEHDLGEEIRARVSQQLQANGIWIRPGAIVDASVRDHRGPNNEKK